MEVLKSYELDFQDFYLSRYIFKTSSFILECYFRGAHVRHESNFRLFWLEFVASSSMGSGWVRWSNAAFGMLLKIQVI